jgi:hypothetical protein
VLADPIPLRDRQSEEDKAPLTRSLVRKSIPFVIGALFLIAIGGGIYKKSGLAVAPPIYDPIAYYHKAKVVWDSIEKGNFSGMLNGVKANRPPGSSLLLYPFGFQPSVRSFLFRSVFVPIALWMLAMAIVVAAAARRTSDAILGGCLVVGLATLPLFHHFEHSDFFNGLYQITNSWGLVDPLQAAVSALAVCLLVVGIRKGSLGLCMAGWFSSALTFFIKPSGSLVMAATVGVAVVELSVRHFRHPEQLRSTLKFAGWLFFGCFMLFVLAAWTALGSDYMSRDMIAAGVKAQGILRLITEGEDLVAVFMRFIVPVIGWWWFCPIAFCLIFLVVEAGGSVARRQWNPVVFRLAGCFVLAGLAIFWWLFLAGTQHRYLFPFILMIIIWLAPSLLERMNEAGASIKSAIACYSLVPALVLVGLLYSTHPPVSLQNAMGVNLTTGQYAFEVQVGQRLLSEADRLNQPVNIYSAGNIRVGVVEMMDRVQSIEAGQVSGKFKVKRPLNWVDIPGLRLQEIVESHFVIVEDVRPPGSAVTAISDWGTEVECFKQHIYYNHGVDKNGLKLLKDGPVKAFRVVDKKLFAKTLRLWAESIRWGNDFRERNRAFLADNQ